MAETMIIKPKITVLMPVYNAEKYLSEAIDSILNQTFKDFEFLIINDASTDNSKKIILSYNDQRIKYLENIKNLGQAATMNIGLKIAKAELIARMDADDVSHPNRLNIQYVEMQNNKNIIILSSNYDVVNESGNYLYTQEHTKSPEEIYYTLQFRNCIGHGTVIFRKSVIYKIYKGYDEVHDSEDYDLWLKTSNKYKISKINTSLLNLRISKTSRMGATGKKLDDDSIIIAKKNIESLTGEKVDNKTIDILRRNFADIRSSTSLVYTKEVIYKAITILQKANNKIRTDCPRFLNKHVLEVNITKKYNNLRIDLYLATLFEIKFGYIIKLFFRVYFFLSNRFIQKIKLIRYSLVLNKHL